MKTLYLIRQPVEKISSSIFLPSQTEGDVLLLEGATSSFSHTTGKVFSTTAESRESQVSYDRVIAMLFEYDRVVVT